VRLNRRNAIAGAAGLAALTALGGERALAQEASPEPSGPRIVETIYGPVEVPANPQRVVALTYISSIAAAELGVVPIGVTRWVPSLPAGFPDLSKAAIIENEAYELDLEAVLALKPDLILGSDVLAEADRSTPYEQLSRIAPTALFEWISGGANWTVEAAGCGEALGKSKEFEALRETYEEKAAAIKETYAETLASLTVDFVDAGDSQWFLHGPASTHCKAAIDAGITLGAGADQAETFLGSSFEELSELAETGAIVLWGEGATRETLEALPTFNSLPAVLAGRVLSTNYFYVASYAQSNALLADLEAGLKVLSGA
jgi:iron complex transport system substrate-binding protein